MTTTQKKKTAAKPRKSTVEQLPQINIGAELTAEAKTHGLELPTFKPGHTYDLYCTHPVEIDCGDRQHARAGLRLTLPQGVVAFLAPYPGLSDVRGVMLMNAGAVLPAGFSGELEAVLYNTDARIFRRDAAEPVAQLLILPFPSLALTTNGAALGEEGNQ
ncbi:hypothetical protein [Microbulbifer sp. PSTR4-B]|uniref:hypothetical protein n=1 Tax=unclassified Microbulbifer TaxID=2619833 RepID=UPI00403AA425